MTTSTTQPPAPDEIGGPATTELAGTQLLYEYSTGRKYHLAFEADNVTFLMIKDEKAKPFSVPYRARKVRDGLYLVHWVVKAASIHVALLLDFERGEVHVAALMPGGIEFFDIAKVEKIDRPSA